MRRLMALILLLILTNFVFGQIDTELARYVDSLASADQKWRGLIRQVENDKIDTIRRAAVIKNINLTDSLNFFQIRKIFNKYGFLGYDIVGKESSHKFWLLIQHADNYPAFQDSVLVQMKIQADIGNASYADYAYLIDRVKVNTGQLQIYGTQMTLNPTKTSYITKPTVDPENLNERRKQVGLSTIEVYIKMMNERYYGTLKK
jgi:hypothetical protein